MRSNAVCALALSAGVLSACSGDTSGLGPPRVPLALTATQLSHTTIRLSWKSSDPWPIYLVQRAAASAPDSFVQIAPPVGRTYFDDYHVTPDVDYRYRVAAVTHPDTSAFTAPVTFHTILDCPAPPPKSVLVDASHDGGAWWYPQVAPFDAAATHQGKLLADTLRSMGYVVDEQGRDDAVSRDLLLSHAVVIRAGSWGAYDTSELLAYGDLVDCPRTLLLLAEYHRSDDQQDTGDLLAQQLGIPLDSSVTGTITTFEPHPITTGVTSVPFIAGSVIRDPVPPSVHVLGWLASGQGAMGVLDGLPARVFFIGDTNGLETIPGPLLNNLISWGF